MVSNHNNNNNNNNDPTIGAVQAALRAYVTAPDTLQAAVRDPSQVLVDVTHSNLQQRHAEIRMLRHAPLRDVYHTIHQKTGSLVNDVQLYLFDDYAYSSGSSGNGGGQLLPLYDHPDAQRPLGYFLSDDVVTGMSSSSYGCRYRIHVVDTNPYSISARGALENTALVEKFRLTDEAYNQRHNTLRSWVKQQQAQNPTFTLQQHAAQHAALREAKQLHKQGLPLPTGFALDENGQVVAVANAAATAADDNSNTNDYGPESVQHCHVNDRCQVQPGGRRGVIMWVGEIPGGYEHWVGIRLDEPVGHNNGTFVQTGVRYFDAPDKYGLYARGKNVQVGDFPERDILDDDDDEDDDEL